MRAAMVGPSAWPSPWLLMSQTCYLDVWRLPEVCQVGFHPKTHEGPHFWSAAATADSSKNPVSHAWNHSELTPLSRMRRLLPVEDDVDQHHPTGLFDVRESATCLLDGLGLSEVRQFHPDRFPSWRRQTGSSCPPWFLMFQTCFLDVWRRPEVRSVGFHP